MDLKGLWSAVKLGNPLRWPSTNIKRTSSAAEFLSSDYVNQTECLSLDIAIPIMSGFELQKELRLRGQQIPIVFITAQTDDAVRVERPNKEL